MNLGKCPFCLAEATMCQTADVALWYYVECSRCFTRQLASETPAEAAHRWNVRGEDWSWTVRNVSPNC